MGLAKLDPPYDARIFQNEPDTDWSLPQNDDWASSIITGWKNRQGSQACEVPLVIGGNAIIEDRAVRDSLDPSRPLALKPGHVATLLSERFANSSL